LKVFISPYRVTEFNNVAIKLAKLIRKTYLQSILYKVYTKQGVTAAASNKVKRVFAKYTLQALLLC